MPQQQVGSFSENLPRRDQADHKNPFLGETEELTGVDVHTLFFEQPDGPMFIVRDPRCLQYGRTNRLRLRDAGIVELGSDRGTKDSHGFA